MTVLEIIDFEAQQRNVQRLKLNAKRQSQQAMAAQARLKMQKARQQLYRATRSSSNTTTP